MSRGPGNFSNRLASVERVLRLLDAMPSAEPPADLAARTLRRIDEARLSPAASGSRERAEQQAVGGVASRPQA